MFDGRWRSNIEKGLKPLGAKIRRTGLKADHITALGVVFAVGAAVAIGAGALRVGLLLLILTGLPDLIDGAVAKAGGNPSQRGAFLDSVADRLTDALLFGGVAYYLAVNEPGPVAILPVAVMVSAFLVSYQRAKADALGYDARGGIMERAERFILLGFGLLFDQLLIPVLWVMLALSVVTAVQRFVKVWRQASEPKPVKAQPTRRRPRRAAQSTTQRWRTRARDRQSGRRSP
ncbi:MAG: CDP-alcohol phosphatidyltransferase family protein [Actinobacteria bacterium]|nr:MAG: CDP-alcohol phosphatidyltransferase family protein [Actinomycetota bacterium]RIK05659.1 MAG: phosphatidylglycerophosphate synthase [Acidobacteriota bacterium]